MSTSQQIGTAADSAIDTAFVLRHEPLYIVTETEDEIFHETAKKVIKREGYKRSTFLTVAKWKAIAALPTLESIRGNDIEYVTEVALSEDTPTRLRAPFLTVLPGVGVPLASTLLAVFDPVKYVIQDARAVGVLHEFGLVPSPNPARIEYPRYRKLVRSLAKGANCAPLDLYRALIAYSRQPSH